MSEKVSQAMSNQQGSHSAPGQIAGVNLDAFRVQYKNLMSVPEVAAIEAELRAARVVVSGIGRVIRLHRPDYVSGLPGGMKGCVHCSHGPGIGDEGGSGGVFWPCPTLRALIDIPEMSQTEAVKRFEAWRATYDRLTGERQ